MAKLVYPTVPKSFNTSGPCLPDRHHMLPPLPRMSEAQALVELGRYFVLRAPRRSGVTTSLLAFARALTASGSYAAIYASCETAEASGDNTEAAQQLIVRSLVRAASHLLPFELQPPTCAEHEADLAAFVRSWCKTSSRPVVLVLDELDTLTPRSLASVLRQLSAGYGHRPGHAPWSVMLYARRDVRVDDITASDERPTTIPFETTLELPDLQALSPGDVTALLEQHTTETGQRFEPDALARITELSGGHPWLVNAIANELTRKVEVDGPIGLGHVDDAEARLVRARATHLDALAHTLAKPRVQRVLAPIIAGEAPEVDAPFEADVAAVVDVGLVRTNPLRIANPIYAEVIARVLSDPVQSIVFVEPRRFVQPDGRFDLDALLRGFAAFWFEPGESLVETMPYAEAGPQLMFIAFLQRVVNGGGVVTHEYGAGCRRIDLLLTWPWTDANGKRQVQREAIELKVWRDGRKEPLDEGLEQLDGYLDRVGLAEGVLILFDRRKAAAPLEQRVVESEARTRTGKRVRVWRG